MKTGAELIHEERMSHPAKGWNTAHDDKHTDGKIALIAADVIMCRADDWNITVKHQGSRIKQLTIAGALIAAEIDRLQRLTLDEQNAGQTPLKIVKCSKCACECRFLSAAPVKIPYTCPACRGDAQDAKAPEVDVNQRTETEEALARVVDKHWARCQPMTKAKLAAALLNYADVREQQKRSKQVKAEPATPAGSVLVKEGYYSKLCQGYCELQELKEEKQNALAIYGGHDIASVQKLWEETHAELAAALRVNGEALDSIRKVTDHALDGSGLKEAVAVLISQRDNARVHFKANAARLKSGHELVRSLEASLRAMDSWWGVALRGVGDPASLQADHAKAVTTLAQTSDWLSKTAADYV